MSALEFLYPVTVALDLAALAACIMAPILAVRSLSRSGWQRARTTIAYIGYLCCAVIATSFALHFAIDGGVIFMMFEFWLVPFSVAAMVAIIVTLVIGSSRGLWILAAATMLLGLVQWLAELSPGGIGGGVAVLLLVAYFAYAFIVLAVSVQRRSEWSSSSRGEA